MKELLNENIGLFVAANTLDFSYKINEDSKFMENSLSLFFFFGKILAKALFDRIPLNICLNRGIFKALLQQKNEYDYTDLEQFKHIDYNVTHSCCLN